MIRFREFGETPGEFVLLALGFVIGLVIGFYALSLSLGPWGILLGIVFLAWRALR